MSGGCDGEAGPGIQSPQWPDTCRTRISYEVDKQLERERSEEVKVVWVKGHGTKELVDTGLHTQNKHQKRSLVSEGGALNCAWCVCRLPRSGGDP